MISVNIRALTHHFSQYLKKVKSGQTITIFERDTPIADVIPHNQNVIHPGWRREIKKVTLKGESLSQTIIKNRREEKR